MHLDQSLYTPVEVYIARYAVREFMTRIPVVMALWEEGFLSDQEVVQWADNQLLKNSEPFDYISELSLKGPKKCSSLPEYAFPKAQNFSYLEKFSLRLANLDVGSEESLKGFVAWVSSACMGRNLEVPEVRFGYLVDHYFNECEDLPFAQKFLKEQIAQFWPKSKNVAAGIWATIA